jgi:hypothetical protein
MEAAMATYELQHIERKQLTELVRMCKKGMAHATLTVEYKMLGAMPDAKQEDKTDKAK